MKNQNLGIGDVKVLILAEIGGFCFIGRGVMALVLGQSGGVFCAMFLGLELSRDYHGIGDRALRRLILKS